MDIESVAISEIGDRSSNEDRFLRMSRRDQWIFAVADGMGGHEAGEVASTAALHALSGAMKWVPGPMRQATGEAILAYLDQSVRVAATLVGEKGKGGALVARRPPGTTLTALVIQAKASVFLHVGDSRLYRSRKGRLEQLTTDQTMPAPYQHVLLWALGMEGFREKVKSDPGEFVGQVDLQAGDRLLLCTDGIHGALSGAEIAKAMAEELHRVPTALVGKCRKATTLSKAGTRLPLDNMTAVVVNMGGA